MLTHVVLLVTTKVDIKEVAEVGQMVTSASAHFWEPRIQLMQPVNPNHVVNISQFLKMFS